MAAALKRSTQSDQDTVGVFVVDDSEQYRKVVSEVLAAIDGFTLVGAASSWNEAQRFVEGSEPDLLLLDVNLGRENGIDVAAEVRRQWPTTKVVLMSTLAIADLPAKARDCGATGFLPKSQLGPRQIDDVWRGLYDWKS